MKHFRAVSKGPALAATTVSSLQIKLDGAIQIIDRLLLAQRQAPWKTPFPVGGLEETTTTTTTSGTTTLPGA